MDPKSVILGGSQVLAVVGRDFFFMLPAWAGSTFSILNGPGPPIDALHPPTYGFLVQFSATCIICSCFFVKSDPRLGRRHIFEDRPTPFCIQKYHFLDPQLELKITIFVSLLVPTTPLFVRFGFFSLLEPTWGQLGANLGPTWGQLGSNLCQLVPTWGQPRRPWGQFRRPWDPLSVNLCHLVPK